jgi:predicted phage terminase large subunit-like protein
VILIQTRWHEDDLAGRMIENDPYVSVWRVPCEAEDGDVLGRVLGEGLCPEIGKGTDWLHAFKDSYIRDSNDGGLRAWNALYQGRPTSAEGNLVRRSWFRYHGEGGEVTVKDGSELVRVPCVLTPSFFDKVWQSWDCTFKDGEKSDFVCGVVIGRRLQDYFILDMVHGRMDIIGTMEAITKLSIKHPLAKAKIIEEKANGSAIIAMLRNSIGGFIPVNPTESKVGRVNAVVPMIHSGNVYLPRNAEWVKGFLEEIAQFPNGTHDDMVDALSQGLKFYMFDESDKSREEIPPGTYVYQMLKLKGWKDNQIRKALKDGRIKYLYGAPKGYVT